MSLVIKQPCYRELSTWIWKFSYRTLSLLYQIIFGMNRKRSLWIVAISCILLASLSRILPHWHNFTAVGATSLFAGFYFRRYMAVLVPLLSIYLSDLILNNIYYSNFFDSFVWLPVFTITSIAIYSGIALLAKMIHRSNRIIGIVSSSLIIS